MNSMSKNIFEIGDIVTLKSHPLAFQENGEIDGYVNHIPPFMCIKEIHIEKKKQLFSNEIKGAKIADNVKYLCVYFNQHRMMFEEKFVYQDMLLSYEDVTFHSKNDLKEDGQVKLIEETSKYNSAKYEFGKRVFFKTYKLEKRKKIKKAGQDNNSTTKTFLSHTSPAFVLNGCKLNDQKSIYNPKDGNLQRKCAEKLYKVIWYNSYQEKFSEEYLPKEFFTDDERIFKNVKSLKEIKPVPEKISSKGEPDIKV